MSVAAFNTLLEVSRLLEDDFIDEDISEVEMGGGDSTHTVSNRTVTVRGEREGQPLVLSYQDYYSTNFNPHAASIYEHSILEMFIAQPKVCFEGTCKRRGFFGRLARWFGRGGARGPHPIFDRLRLDSDGPANVANFHDESFPDALEKLMLRPDVKRILLQAGGGLSAVVVWQVPSPSADFVLALIDEVRSVANTLG